MADAGEALKAEQAVAEALRGRLSDVEKQHATLGAQLVASQANIEEQRNSSTKQTPSSPRRSLR